MNPLPIIVAVGLPRRLTLGTHPGFTVVEAPSPADAFRRYSVDQMAILVLGPAIRVAEVRAQLGSSKPEIIVLFDDFRPEEFQQLVDDDSIFYASRLGVCSEDLNELVASAVRKQTLAEPRVEDLTGSELDERILHTCCTVSRKMNLPAFAQSLANEMRACIPCSSFSCLIFDHATNTLYDAERGREERETSAALGLAGFVAQTGRAISRESLAGDPLLDPESDSGGEADCHLEAEPLRSNGGPVRGVLLLRRFKRPFTNEDRAFLRLFARRTAPLLELQLAAEHIRLEKSKNSQQESPLFLQEALDVKLGREETSSTIWSIPKWLMWSHAGIALIFALAIAFVMLAQVHQAVSGPAVVRIDDEQLQGVTQTHDYVDAVLPGSYASQITPGMKLILGVDGYPQSEEVLTIARIRPNLLGLKEASAVLGDEKKLASQSGAFLVVSADLPRREFESLGRRYPFQNGMAATAQIKTGSQSLLSILAPSLRLVRGSTRLEPVDRWSARP